MVEPVTSDIGESRAQLLRGLGPLEGATIVVGTVIGSGIFIKPALIATQVPSFGVIVLVWVVSGLLSLAGALAYAELGAMIPKAGGQYVFLRVAYGPFIAFLFGWMEFLVNRPGSLAALATATAIYFNELVPLGSTGQNIVAIGAIAILTTINYRGVRFGGAIQNLFTIAKVLALLGLIAGAALLGVGSIENYQPLWPDHFDAGSLKLFGAAMIGALWAYDGWGNATAVSEELREPQKNVPFSLIVGTLFIIAIYVTANFAYHYVLPINDIQRCNPDKFPGSHATGAAVALKLIGHFGLTLISLGVMCSTFGAANGAALTGARITFAMSRQREFFAGLNAVHPSFRTPHISILVQGIWSCALIVAANLMVVLQKAPWFPRGMSTDKPVFDILTESVIVASWVFYALAVGAVFILRRKLPDTPRPYRCWGYPFVPLLFMVMAIWFVGNAFFASPLESGFGFGITGIGVVAYLFFLRRNIGGAPAVVESPGHETPRD